MSDLLRELLGDIVHEVDALRMKKRAGRSLISEPLSAAMQLVSSQGRSAQTVLEFPRSLPPQAAHLRLVVPPQGSQIATPPHKTARQRRFRAD
jgi:hypothetical protein